MNLLSLTGLALLWGGFYLVVRRWSARSTRSVPKFLAETVAVAGLLALATVGFFWQVDRKSVV